MKTEMQELQEKITTLINDSKSDDTRTGDYRIGLHQSLSLIDLEAEKKQIIEAWESGYSNGVRSVSRGEPKIKSSEEYYNLTFKSDE